MHWGRQAVIDIATESWVSHDSVAFDMSQMGTAQILEHRFIQFTAKTHNYGQSFEFKTKEECSEAFDKILNHINSLKL